MLSFVRQHSLALLGSFVLHAALAAVLAFSIVRHPPMVGASSTQVAIEATVVDSTRIEEEMRRLEAAEQAEVREREAEAERLREEAAQARRAQEEEERRLAELREQRTRELDAEQKRQQEAEAQRRTEEEAERKRVAAAEAERKREAEQMAEALRQREEAKQELRRQQEAERERLEELERRRKEEEQRLAKLEEERRAAEEARARTEREAALRAEIEAEQQLAALKASPMAQQYRTLLEQSIKRQWSPPPSAQAGIECTVHVTQIPSGDVVGVRVGACNGDDAVIRSIEAAVHRASPLPRPPDPKLFERNLELVFAPDQ
ncbi:hypothetical protein BH24PSE2_BH24PSE2_24760 [soil metagenome]